MKRAMTRKCHKPEEIMAKLREADEALPHGKTLEDVAKSLGVSLMILHRWRTEYGSTGRDAVKRLKELKRENGRLKGLVANQVIDMQILKGVARGNSKSGDTASVQLTHHDALLRFRKAEFVRGLAVAA